MAGDGPPRGCTERSSASPAGRSRTRPRRSRPAGRSSPGRRAGQDPRSRCGPGLAAVRRTDYQEAPRGRARRRAGSSRRHPGRHPVGSTQRSTRRAHRSRGPRSPHSSLPAPRPHRHSPPPARLCGTRADLPAWTSAHSPACPSPLLGSQRPPGRRAGAATSTTTPGTHGTAAPAGQKSPRSVHEYVVRLREGSALPSQ